MNKPTPSERAENGNRSELFQTWAEQIRHVSGFLGSIIKDREQDFLDLGQQLHEISSRSGRLSSKSDQLMNMTSGDRNLEAQQALKEELKDVNDFCDVSWGEKSADLLGSVLEQTRSLSQEMNDFKKIVRTLNVLSFTTRIESARLGDIGRGFMTLADDVESLGKKMVGHWQRIVDESDVLYDLVQSARTRVQILVRDQKTEVEKVLKDIKANLADLEKIRDSSIQGSSHLSDRAADITAGIRDMVSSMQFHDITRQVVEHVQGTLNEVLSLMEQNGTQEGLQCHASTKQLAGWVNRVCALQVCHMDQAGNSFFEAVENLKSNLNSIAGNISGMLQGLRASLGIGEGQQSSLLASMESNISRVKASIEKFIQQSREIGDIMQTVGGSISQMSSFINDIEEVGSEIELIALNASVRAAHTGSEGMALGVVAVAIQQLSGRAREKSGAVTGTLNTISSDAERLQELTAIAVDLSGFEALTAKIDGSLHKLGHLNNEIQEKLEEIISSGSSLAENINFLSENIDFHHDVSSGMQEARQKLEKIVQETESEFDSDFTNVEWPETLNKMFEKYTMESQRLVHKTQLEGRGQESELPDTSENEPELWQDDEDAGDSHDFGDNIELF